MMISTISPKKALRKSVSVLLPLAFWLGVWQLGAMAVERAVAGRGNELFLPYPATVWRAFLALAGTWAFWNTIGATLRRVLFGMAWGCAAGTGLAVLTCASSLCALLISPAVQVIRATPVASFIILVLLWVRRSWVPVVIAGLMVLPVVWANVVRGIWETDSKLLELAKVYRFSRSKTLRLVYLPTVRPYFLSAVTTAMGLAWKSGVAAEVLCLAKPSVGAQIYNTKLDLEIPALFAWTLAVVGLSLLLERLITLVLERWKGRRRA